MMEVGVHYGGHPRASIPSPPQVLDVIAPDEELGAHRSDAFDQLTGHQHPVERDHHVGDGAVDGDPFEFGQRPGHGSGARQSDREAQFSRSLLGEHRWPPEIELAAVIQQLVETLRRRQAVVVHQPGKFETQLI